MSTQYVVSSDLRGSGLSDALKCTGIRRSERVGNTARAATRPGQCRDRTRRRFDLPRRASRDHGSAHESVLVAVSVRFLGQPGFDESTIADFLARSLNDASIDSITIAVAWARFRGLVRLRPGFRAFRERGGTARLIVGIDEGGATRPGLLLATRMFDEAHVFHDAAGGTFHPKVYLAEGRKQAILVVGSSNATPGGWFSNYEASVEVRFALPENAEDPALRGARDYIRSLIDEPELCVPLTDELVDRLVRDRRYDVAGHERSIRRRGRAVLAGAEDTDTDASGSTGEPSVQPPVFGRRRGRRGAVPALSLADREELESLEIPPDAEAESDTELAVGSGDQETAGVQAAPEPVGAPVMIWTKVLPRGDAQQQQASGTNFTANVRPQRRAMTSIGRPGFETSCSVRPAGEPSGMRRTTRSSELTSRSWLPWAEFRWEL